MADWSTDLGHPLSSEPTWREPAPEEMYQKRAQQLSSILPKSVKPTVQAVAPWVAPQTPAEAAVMATQGLTDIGLGVAAAGAPETAGLSLLPAIGLKYALPLGVAGTVGAWEAPPGQRWQRSKEEMEKTALGLALSKPAEWLLRMPSRLWASREMLEKSAGRIMRGVKGVFTKYPEELGTTEDMAGIKRDITSGKLKDSVERRLGAFRDKLRKAIPGYTPEKPATVAHTLEGRVDTPAVPAKGEAFEVFEPDDKGNMVPKNVSIGDGIDHVQKENGMGYSGGGSETGGALSWAHRKAGHMSRDSIYKRLNEIGAKYGIPLAGDIYRAHSGDAGVADILTDTFKNAQREMAHEGVSFPVIDQRKVDSRIEAEMPHLRKLKPDKVDAFKSAVSPTGGRALVTGGRTGLRPFLPESRSMYGLPTRVATQVPHLIAPQLGRTVPAGKIAGLALQRLKEMGLSGIGLPETAEPMP
jgi:hypothetical protein